LKRLLITAATLSLLSACTESQLETAASVTTAVNTDVGAAAQTVSTICSLPATQQLISDAAGSAATADPTSAAGILLKNAQASCTTDGQVAATLAPKVDTSTPTWLTNLLQGLATAAQLAPYILPLI
jgi:hypothetical protein